MSRLGIIAGFGSLPFVGMEQALKEGEDPVFLGIKESHFQVPEKYKKRYIPIHITQIGNLIKICKKNQIDRLVLLGKVNKNILFKNFKFDLKTILLMAKMKNKNDYSIFETVAKELNKHEIEIIPQKIYLKKLFLPSGRYTKKKLLSKHIRDINFGIEEARKIAKLNIGQTVVVLNQSVLSVEAIEGTDEAILRAGRFCGKYQPTVCKTAKKNQDERFDLPTLGISTLKILKKSNCCTLAFDSKHTIIIEPKNFIELAEKYQINIISCDEELKDIQILKSYEEN